MIGGLTVDVLVLARYAESRENMLNLLGGGIDRFDVPAFPAQIGFGVGISLRIPWAHIGSEHRIDLVPLPGSRAAVRRHRRGWRPR